MNRNKARNRGLNKARKLGAEWVTLMPSELNQVAVQAYGKDWNNLSPQERFAIQAAATDGALNGSGNEPNKN